MVTIPRNRVVGSLSAALLGAAVGVMAVPAANAATDVPSGAYQETDETGSYTWNFAPCGTTCTMANSPDDDSVVNLEFHLKDGRWSATNPYQIHCSHGESVAGTITYNFDATSLGGEYFLKSTAEGCGKPAGSQGESNAFQLTKAG